MENKKWNDLLVEWVNCLNLSKTISNIEDLKNEDFFNNLQKVITKSSNLQKDPLSFMFGLFAEHYPKYTFKTDKEIHLSDINLTDLTELTSLLMHYTCIYDRRDVLTSPLCYSLTQNVQVSIKNFLQKVTSSITNDELKSIILECSGGGKDANTTTNNNSQWLSCAPSPNSRFSNSSPLHEILRTPVSKTGRMHEKNKIITKLKSELEMERFEKADLQEELKNQADKTKKLDKLLGKRNSEISRLRLEIIALEERTPPCYQDVDSREIQKRYRSEIESLEQYVKQIETEQETLWKEKDTFKEKLRDMESQCLIWQEKYFTTEKNLESLSEHSQEQDILIKSLQTHCNELSALLEEFKEKHDNRYDDSFQIVSQSSSGNTTASCEDLAHSVVEVQLREAQKQCEEVSTKLKNSNDKCTALEKDKDGLLAKVSEISEKFEQTKEELSTVNKDRAELGLIIIKTNETVLMLEQQLQSSKQQFDTLQEIKNALEENVQQLNFEKKELVEHSNEVKKELADIESANKKMEHIIKQLQTENSELLQAHENTVQTLQKELDLLNLKLVKSEEDNEIKSHEISRMQSNINSLMKDCDDFKNSLHLTEEKLKVTEFSLTSCENTNKLLQEELEVVNVKVEEVESVLKKTEEQLMGSLKQNAELLQSYENIKREYLEIQKEFVNFKNYLMKYKTSSEAQIQQFVQRKEQIIEMITKVDTLGSLVETVSKKFAENQKILTDFQIKTEILKNENTSLLEKIDDLLILNYENKSAIELKDKHTSEMQTKINQLSEISEKLKYQLTETETKLNTVENTLKSSEINKTNLEEKVHILNQQIEENSLVIEKLEKERELLQEELICAKETTNKFCTNLKEAQEEIGCQKNEIDSKVIECTQLESDKAGLEEALKCIEEEKLLLEHQLIKANESIAILEHKTQEFENKNQKNDLEILKLQQQLSDTIEICNEGKIQLSKIEEKLKETTNNFVSKQLELEQSNKIIDEYTEENKIKFEENEKLIKENTSLVRKLDDLTKNCMGTKEILNSVQEEVVTLSALKESLQNEVTQLNETLSESLNSLATLQKDYDTIKQNLSVSKDELMTTKSELENCNGDLRNQTEQNEELVKKIKELNNEHTKLLQELDEAVNITEAKQIENTQLRELLDNYKAQKDSLEIELQKCYSEIKMHISEFEKLNELKSAISIQSEETSKKYEELQTKCEISQQKLIILQEENATIEANLGILKDELIVTQKELDKSNNNLENQTVVNEELVKKIANLNDERLKLLQEIQGAKIAITAKEKENAQLLDVLENHKAQSNATLETVKDTLIVKETELQNCYNQIETRVHELKEVNEEKSAISIQLEEASKKYEELQTEFNASQKELIALEGNFSILKDELIVTQKELDKSNNNVQNQTVLIKELTAKIANLNDERSKLLQEIDDAKAAIAAKEKENTQLLEAVENHKAQSNSLEANLETVKETLIMKETELQNCYKQIETHVQEREKLLIQSEETYKEYEELQTEFKIAQKDLLTLQEEHAIMEENSKALNEKLIITQKELEKSNNNLQNQTVVNEELKQEIANLNDEHSKLLLQIEEAKATIAKKEKETSQLLENQKAQNNSLETAKETLLEQETELQKRYNQIETYVQELEKLKDENTIISKKSDEIQTELTTLNTRNNSLEEKVKTLKNIIVESEENVISLQKEKNAVFEELEKFKNHNSFVEEKLKSTEDNLLIFKNSHDVLQKTLEVLKSNATFNERQVQEMHDRIELLQNENEKLKENYENSREELQEILQQTEVFQKDKRELIAKLKEENAVLNNKLSDNEVKGSSIENALKELETQNVQLKDTYENVCKQYTESTEILKHTEKKLQTTEEESDILKSKLDDAVAETNQVLEKYELLEQQNSENIKKIELETNSKLNIESQFNEVTHNYNRLQEKIKHLLQLNTQISCEEAIEGFIEEAHKNKSKMLDEINKLKSEIEEYNKIVEQLKQENLTLLSQKDGEVMALESLQTDYDLLMGKYNQAIENNSVYNEQKKEALLESCKVLKYTSCTFKKEIENILSQRNTLENLLSSMRTTMICVQQNAALLRQPTTSKQILERKETLEIIFEDIYKHANKITRQSNDIIMKMIHIYDNGIDEIISNVDLKIQINIFNNNNLNINEVVEKVTDLNDRTSDALEQLKTLNKEIENILHKQEGKPLKCKENILSSSNDSNYLNKFKEEEWKKKNMMLKQKLTLTENSRSNLERKVKQLQEEIKKVSQQTNFDGDIHYKVLLQEHTVFKDQYEKLIEKFDQLSKENAQLKEIINKKSHNDVLPIKLPKEDGPDDLFKIREAYGDVVSDNSKLEMENVALRQKIEERNAQLIEVSHIKEAYEKLIEENNKLVTDVDTIKYKRSRDRDEFVRLLKKEREDAENRETGRLNQVRAEYESKLEKMKGKMLKLYKEEICKEMERVKINDSNNSVLLQTIENLKVELFEAEQKISFLEIDKDMLRQRQAQTIAINNLDQQNLYNSRESLQSLHSNNNNSEFRMPEAIARTTRRVDSRDSCRDSLVSYLSRNGVSIPETKVQQKTHSLSRQTQQQLNSKIEERRFSTLPRSAAQMNVIEEVTFSRRTSIDFPNKINENLHVEDEDEEHCFDNKYLADLKEGRCAVTAHGPTRFSELAWRNSLVPPHLKSSYPAELQFVSPNHYKEDEIKSGNIELDNSQCKLLPNEKPRRGKDFGTTSYKKPGPPTPSKNGGRLSLQGNELHPLREQNSENVTSKTPKRTTPNRIKALFMGKINSVRDSTTENQQLSPKSRRVSNFFRKPR